MAFLDIKRASDGGSKIGAFILASCFIDYMAGFAVGKQSNGKDYKAFVKNYLPPCYVPDKLYTDLRCKLVHNYSEGGSYIFVDGEPQLHKQMDGNKMIINLENFIDDLETAFQKLLYQIENDPNCKAAAMSRYKAIGLLDVMLLPLKTP
jgi:hypothetical protein